MRANAVRAYVTLLGLLLYLFSFNANALSCSDFLDRVIAPCVEGKCSSILYVSEIKAFGDCARKPIIETPPAWAKGVLEYEIQQRNRTDQTAIYELTLRNTYGLKKFRFRSEHEYILNRSDYKMPLSTFGELLQLDSSSISDLKSEWTSIAKKASLIDLAWSVVNWVSLVVSVTLFVFSILWFNRWIKKGGAVSWFLAALLVQLSIASISIFVMSTTWELVLMVYVGLLVPVVWLYQSVILISEKLGKN